jgi:hypothetical protein
LATPASNRTPEECRDLSSKLLPRERISDEPDRGNERNGGELDHALSEPHPHSPSRKKTGTLPESCDDFQNPMNHFDHHANGVHETSE